MMACFATTLCLITLSGFINLSAANKDTCDVYAAVGQNLTLPFVYDGLGNSNVLRWTHEKLIILYTQQGRFTLGKPTDISANGSLLLRNLQISNAGTYQGTVLHSNGTLAKTWTGRLCVMHKVSKPQLSYNCDFKLGAVNLYCQVANPQTLLFSWTLDEKTLTSETKEKLSISLTQLKVERNFTCSVANKVSKEKSDTVRPACKSPPPPPLLCFKSKTVLAVLGGGACLILLLLTIIIFACCCRKRSKNQMRLQDKRQIRMVSLSKPESISPEYETMHPTEESPPLSPEPAPRECYENVSQPEAQPENRPLQLDAAAEGQKPSPVPKPRTKNPKTLNI